MRVLIAEDESLPALALQIACEEAGFEVLGPAATAEQAIAIASETLPDIMILDVQLVGVRDGLSAGDEIRKFANIPCVITTAFRDPATRSRAEKLQPVAWFTKPYHLEALIEAIEKALLI